MLGSRADKLKGEDAARTAREASPWRRGQRHRFLPGAQCTLSPPSGSQSVKDQGHHGGREVQVGPHLVSTSHPRQCVSMMKECMMAKRGTLVDTWLVPVGPRCGGGDETPVVESEGKRSSMRQMVPAGWSVHTVPSERTSQCAARDARALHKRRLQCWLHGTIAHLTSSNAPSCPRSQH